MLAPAIRRAIRASNLVSPETRTAAPNSFKNFATILQQQLRKKVTITVDGKPKRVTVQEVIARRLANDSMKGTTKAMELLIRLTSAKSDDGAGKDAARGNCVA